MAVDFWCRADASSVSHVFGDGFLATYLPTYGSFVNCKRTTVLGRRCPRRIWLRGPQLGKKENAGQGEAEGSADAKWRFSMPSSSIHPCSAPPPPPCPIEERRPTGLRRHSAIHPRSLTFASQVVDGGNCPSCLLRHTRPPDRRTHRTQWALFSSPVLPHPPRGGMTRRERV